MELKDLKIGNDYYLTEINYYCKFEGKGFYSHKEEFMKDPLKLLEIGIYEVPILKQNDEFDVYNNVKLLHKKTGIIIYTSNDFLNNFSMSTIKFYKELQPKLENVFKNINKSFNDLLTSYTEIKSSIKQAKEEEFKVKRLTIKERVDLLIYKLEFLIDNSLENNDKSKFELYSERYNIIKNKYCNLIKR